MSFILTKFFNFILDLFFPKFCVECGKFDTYLCPKCANQIEYQALSFTPRDSYLERILVMSDYSQMSKKLIATFKYQGVRGIGKLLGYLAYQSLSFPKVELIVAIPLHPKRFVKRGFNQAEIIAQSLAKEAKIPYLPLLVRQKHLSAQAKIKDHLKRQQRVKNIFSINPLYPIKVLPESVLVVDDVTTTGATLNECARVLKKIGIKKVYGLAIAHGQ